MISADGKPVAQQDYVIASVFLAGALLMTLILRGSLMMENRRRDCLSDGDYNREASVKEPCDWVTREYVLG